MYIKKIEEHINTMITKTHSSEEQIRKIVGKIESNLKNEDLKNIDKFFSGLKLEVDRSNSEEMLFALSQKWDEFPNYRKYITGIIFAGKEDAAFFAYMMNNYYYGIPQDDKCCGRECKNTTIDEMQREIDDIQDEEII